MATYLSPGVYVNEVPSGLASIAGVGTSTAGFIGVFGDKLQIPVENPDYDPTLVDSGAADAADAAEGDAPASKRKSKAAANAPYTLKDFKTMEAGDVKFVTNFREFERYFGTFSTDADHRNLAHAIYGFFNNGGTRCYVVREKSKSKVLTSALVKFEAIDDISIVAAPGNADDSIRSALVSHCKKMGDRFAILDCEEEYESDGMFDKDKLDPPTRSDYAAVYIPYFSVLDPATAVMDPTGSGLQFVPPSGHMAGIYARTDSERGVHKAPANTTVMGVGSGKNLKYRLSKAYQDGLNPVGINCIRDMNNSVTVWGARTIGGDANGEWKYVPVRRLFLYLRESIDKGTQWVVFEPNTPELWARITRNVTAFLMGVWRDGALFGNTPQEAFYVKCDAETNPQDVRDRGQVITEVGLAVSKPAEFVVFNISQWAADSSGE